MEWWHSGYTFLTLLALFGVVLAFGKTQYEKNPDFFEHNHSLKDIKNWRTWKYDTSPSVHTRITNKK